MVKLKIKLRQTIPAQNVYPESCLSSGLLKYKKDKIYLAVWPGEQHRPSPPSHNCYPDSRAVVKRCYCSLSQTFSIVGTKYKLRLDVHIMFLY